MVPIIAYIAKDSVDHITVQTNILLHFSSTVMDWKGSTLFFHLVNCKRMYLGQGFGDILMLPDGYSRKGQINGMK